MDFITGLPPSSGNSVILTIVDCFSKKVHLVPLRKLPTSKKLSKIMAKRSYVCMVSQWTSFLTRDHNSYHVSGKNSLTSLALT